MIKRGFDLICSAAGILVLSPLLASISLAIVVFDGQPVLFRQRRVGRHGSEFTIFKFRTMRSRPGGPEVTADGDDRITRTGQLLRKSKMDELPQLFNVLKGEMSLVGPRPEVPRYVRLYNDDQRRVLELKPGITDPASIKYRDENALLANAEDLEREYIQTIMPDKISINLSYAAEQNFRSDMAVLVKTLLRIAA
ncbi:MAG: sugar transferase [Candidatus Paceibacterota bacterium]